MVDNEILSFYEYTGDTFIIPETTFFHFEVTLKLDQLFFGYHISISTEHENTKCERNRKINSLRI